MFTKLDKAVVTLIMAVIFILNSTFGFDIGLTEEAVSNLIAGLTPILVYLIPNKK